MAASIKKTGPLGVIDGNGTLKVHFRWKSTAKLEVKTHKPFCHFRAGTTSIPYTLKHHLTLHLKELSSGAYEIKQTLGQERIYFYRGTLNPRNCRQVENQLRRKNLIGLDERTLEGVLSPKNQTRNQ